MEKDRLPRGAGVVVLALALLGIGYVGPASTATAAGACAKWAATTGDDGNAGTEAAPYRSLNQLVAALAPGQTGCLPANQTYYAVQGNGIVNASPGIAGQPVTITSGPGGRAIVKGGLLLNAVTHDIVLENLGLAGAYNPDGTRFSTKGVFLLLFGDRLTLRDNDITSPPGICIQLGNSNIADPADDVVVTGNRIHHCGTDPALVWTDGDSGAHGLYTQNTNDALIAENIFHGNKWRGLQFWPRNDGAMVRNNLFVGNATQINLGYDPEHTTNVTVKDNILTQRVTDWYPDDNPAQIFAHLPNQPLGNVVQTNCYAPGDTFTLGNGITLGAGNLAANPTFVNAAAGDFRLTEGSACTGWGPGSIQPGVGPEPGPAPPLALQPLTKPRLRGTATVGTRVRVTKGVWPAGTTLSHRWYAGGVAIKKATNPRLRITPKLLGKVLKVKVTASAPGYYPTRLALRLKGRVRVSR